MAATEAPPVVGLRSVARVPGPALLLLTVNSAQFGSALGAKVISHTGPTGAVLLRLAFAAVALGVLARPRLRGLSNDQWRLAFVFAAVMAVMNVCFYEAISRLDLGVVVTIEFVGPLGVAIAFSRRRLDLVWVVLAATGIVVLAHPGGASIDTAGLLFTLAAASLWATYIVLARHLGDHFGGADGITIAMVLAAVMMVIPGVLDAGGTLVHPGVLALGLGAGLLSSAIPYTLEIEALRRMPPTVFGVFMSLEPGVAALAGFLVLGQALSAADLVAIALVVAASVGAALSGAPATPLDG